MRFEEISRHTLQCIIDWGHLLPAKRKKRLRQKRKVFMFAFLGKLIGEENAENRLGKKTLNYKDRKRNTQTEHPSTSEIAILISFGVNEIHLIRSPRATTDDTRGQFPRPRNA